MELFILFCQCIYNISGTQQQIHSEKLFKVTSGIILRTDYCTIKSAEQLTVLPLLLNYNYSFWKLNLHFCLILSQEFSTLCLPLSPVLHINFKKKSVIHVKCMKSFQKILRFILAIPLQFSILSETETSDFFQNYTINSTYFDLTVNLVNYAVFK